MEIRRFGKNKIKQSNISWEERRHQQTTTTTTRIYHHIIETTTLVGVFKHWTRFFSCNTAAIHSHTICHLLLMLQSCSYVSFESSHSVTHPSLSLLKCKIDWLFKIQNSESFKLIFTVLVKKHDQKQHPSVPSPPLNGISLTHSLTHSSLKGFPLEFIFVVERWVVVLINLLQYWIQVLDSLLSICKPNVDSISWSNWRARERERVLGTIFYLCFFPPSRCSSILDFVLHHICEKTFVLGICEKITEATPQGIHCCQLPWVPIPQLYLIHQLGIYTSITMDWIFSSLITVVSLLQSFASSSLSVVVVASGR